ncbi:hypothetical protein HMN09_00860800 [Mycena chlorophos]|uniref:Uncharacterized protein n=1 Tax=Mycena chlorophos TaxID=658473 RepID=A0A8H6W7J6_MYCCL|nr:hypothetical protein HMN09_00860800 [Mycena chlorophos]
MWLTRTRRTLPPPPKAYYARWLEPDDLHCYAATSSRSMMTWRHPLTAQDETSVLLACKRQLGLQISRALGSAITYLGPAVAHQRDTVQHSNLSIAIQTLKAGAVGSHMHMHHCMSRCASRAVFSETNKDQVSSSTSILPAARKLHSPADRSSRNNVDQPACVQQLSPEQDKGAILSIFTSLR